MPRYRVLIADNMSAEGLAPLSRDNRFELIETNGLKGEDLARAIEPCDAVIVRSSTRITRESLAYANRLRVIGRAGVGVDNIDVAAATERGVAVLNAPSGNTLSAAELSFALLLSLARRIPAADRSMRAGEWDRKSFAGFELHGKTLGLIGAGRIGGEVARRARAFGMHVIVSDPYLSAERALELDVERVSFDDVIEQADVISLHVPLTDATNGLIGARELARMKRTAVIVNAARGEVIQEDELANALRSGAIAGAALDVFAEEPLPANHPLRQLPNVVLTPHLGAQTAEAQHSVAIEISEGVRRALIDSDMTSAVNAPAIGGDEMRRLRPLLDLSERLGRLAGALTTEPVTRIAVRYGGPNEAAMKPITCAAIAGVLRDVVGSSAVNLVNAIHVAESRGIRVERTRVGTHGSDEEFIEVRLGKGDAETRAAGALVAGRHPRIVRINRYRVVVHPSGSLLVIRNHDVPGVIGYVGTVLGRAAINIGEYHQARMQAGGEALAAVSVDGRIPDDVMERLRELQDVLEARQVDLG
ncbi:MAG: phosphoglycerate dehydrogenase [Longimicrobiales bacterium]